MKNSDIRHRLHELQIPEDNVDQVISDVTKVAMDRVLVSYIQKLPIDVQNQLDGHTDVEIAAFFESNRDNLPLLTQVDIDSEIDATWQDYFSV